MKLENTPYQEVEKRVKLQEKSKAVRDLENQMMEVKNQVKKILSALDGISYQKDNHARQNAKLEAIKAILGM